MLRGLESVKLNINAAHYERAAARVQPRAFGCAHAGGFPRTISRQAPSVASTARAAAGARAVLAPIPSANRCKTTTPYSVHTLHTPLHIPR